MNLEILIITYNRSKDLKNTLQYFVGSVLKDYNITILDNCSMDNTESVCEEFKSSLRHLKYIKNKINIGANANILRAIELSNSDYTWVVCDDDYIDLSYFDDVLEKITENKFDLIHVGGHPQKKWKFGGLEETLQKLLKNGYPYFKLSSFLPTNIFRTELFQKEMLVPGYNNVGNAYPHMPYLFYIYSQDKSIYISKKQVVVASTTGQSYTISNWYTWWMRTCELLNSKDETRLAFVDQWNNIDEPNELNAIRDLYLVQKRNPDDRYIRYFINTYFNCKDKKFLKKLEKSERWNKKKEEVKLMFPYLLPRIKKIFR